MSDETSKDQTKNTNQEGVEVRKKVDTQVTEPTDLPVEEAKPAYSAKAQDKVSRTRVAYAEGFSPSTTVNSSSEEQVETKPSPTAEGLTTAAIPEASNVTTDDFASMFEDSASSTPTRKVYNVGDQVDGVVEHIDTNYIFINMGGRGEGRASRAQFTDGEGELELSLGQGASFYILAIKGDGIVLGKHLDDRDSGIFAVEQAMEAGLPVKGRVIATNKGGFDVEILGVSAFCPRSQIDLYGSDDTDQYLNLTLEFRIIDVRDGGRNVVVSRAALLRDAAASQRAKTMEVLKPDLIVTGVVRSLSDYGAFVDLGGVDGLVHISEISWGNLAHPKDALEEGQEVEVKVLNIEEREKGVRISLSMKQAQSDPWDDVNSLFAVGQEITGTVARIAHFGAFVELKAGVDGLVHISEMSWKRISSPADVVSVGDKVNVKIKDIDIIKRRLSLSMRDAGADPWSDIESRYVEGQKIEGVVESTKDFGAFISLEEGVTALLPRSEMSLSSNATPQSTYRKGQSVTAFVLNVDTEQRKMSVSVKEEGERQTRQAPKNKREKTQGRPRKQPKAKQENTSFGTMADLFKQKK